MFSEMRHKHVRPSAVTFSILVKAVMQASPTESCVSVSPSLQLLSHAGRLDLAVHLVAKDTSCLLLDVQTCVSSTRLVCLHISEEMRQIHGVQPTRMVPDLNPCIGLGKRQLSSWGYESTQMNSLIGTVSRTDLEYRSRLSSWVCVFKSPMVADPGRWGFGTPLSPVLVLEAVHKLMIRGLGKEAPSTRTSSLFCEVWSCLITSCLKSRDLNRAVPSSVIGRGVLCCR